MFVREQSHLAEDNSIRSQCFPAVYLWGRCLSLTRFTYHRVSTVDSSVMEVFKSFKSGTASVVNWCESDKSFAVRICGFSYLFDAEVGCLVGTEKLNNGAPIQFHCESPFLSQPTISMRCTICREIQRALKDTTVLPIFVPGVSCLQLALCTH